MLKREGYTKRMAHKLRAWMSRFEARRREAAKGGDPVAADLRERLEASKVAGDVAIAKLAELRRARARYARVRNEMEVVWKSIDDGGPDTVERTAGRKHASDA